jgi:sortase A
MAFRGIVRKAWWNPGDPARPEKTDFMRTRRIELVLLGIGLTLLVVWGGAWIHRTISSRAAVRRFEADQAKSSGVESETMNDPISGSRVDFSLWSAKRVGAYKESLVTKVDRPLAVLRIPKIHLEVPVYNDTDDVTLNRGVGRILGTAQVGEGGNLGIAGHRDGFFRGLKDLAPGDEVDLVRIGQSDTYVVEEIQIVSPEDVSVLNPTPAPSLTLVTCFPFYYVGSAPQRFIVHASKTGFDQSRQEVSQSKSALEKINNKERNR